MICIRNVLELLLMALLRSKSYISGGRELHLEVSSHKSHKNTAAPHQDLYARALEQRQVFSQTPSKQVHNTCCPWKACSEFKQCVVVIIGFCLNGHRRTTILLPLSIWQVSFPHLTSITAPTRHSGFYKYATNLTNGHVPKNGKPATSSM